MEFLCLRNFSRVGHHVPESSVLCFDPLHGAIETRSLGDLPLSQKSLQSKKNQSFAVEIRGSVRPLWKPLSQINSFLGLDDGTDEPLRGTSIRRTQLLGLSE